MEPNRYVLQFSGEDIPGLISETGACMSELGFIIESITASTGAGKQSAFITCKPDTNANGIDISNLMFGAFADAELLKYYAQLRLSRLYENYCKDGEMRPGEGIWVHVTYLTEQRSPYRLTIDTAWAQDKRWILACMATALSLVYTIDHMFGCPDGVGGSRVTLLLSATPKSRTKDARDAVQEFLKRLAPDKDERNPSNARPNVDNELTQTMKRITEKLTALYKAQVAWENNNNNNNKEAQSVRDAVEKAVEAVIEAVGDCLKVSSSDITVKFPFEDQDRVNEE